MVRTLSVFRIAAVAGALGTLLALTAAPAPAIPPPAPPQQALAASGGAFLWFHDEWMTRVTASGERRSVLPPPSLDLGGPYWTASSSAGAALITQQAMFTVTSAGRALRVPRGRVGCWEAGDPGLQAFVAVRGETVVADGTWACTSPVPRRRPLFAKPLRGGRWRVLRWVASDGAPLLAAEGDDLAVGLQEPDDRQMRVQIFVGQAPTPVSQFVAPDGYLAFAGPERLVDSVEIGGSYPLPVAVTSGGMSINGGAVRMTLYDLRGHRIARLGTSTQLPLADGARLVYATSRGAVTTLVQRALPAGPVRRIVGFRNPGRVLFAMALAGSRLGLAISTSAPQPPGHYSCVYGAYQAPSPVRETTYDLGRPGAYNPPPPAAPTPPPQLVQGCGPSPP